MVPPSVAITPQQFNQIEARYEEALIQRGEALRREHRAGATVRALAEKWGISFQRVQQIVSR